MATIAEIVSQLDPKLQVGALNGIVDAIFHPEHAEDGTGDPYEQALYDGRNLATADAADNKLIVARLEASVSAPDGLVQKALDGGYEWLTTSLYEFGDQLISTFPIDPKTDAYGFPGA